MLSCIISRNKTSLETVYNAKHIDFVTTKQRKCFQGFLVIVSRVSSFKKNNLAVIKIYYSQLNQRLFTTGTSITFQSKLLRVISKIYVHGPLILNFNLWRQTVRNTIQIQVPKTWANQTYFNPQNKEKSYKNVLTQK